MIKSKNINPVTHLPPFVAISAATEGDSLAMEKLVSFYAPYMRELATKELYDASGRRYLVMNQDLYLQLENKLIESVLKFKLRFNRGC